MRNTHLLNTLIVVAILAFTCRVKAWDKATVDKTLSPYFVVENADSTSEAFPLKRTRVDGTINGIIADVTVTQTYTNAGQIPINARYVFPASTRASVHGLKMTIGDRVVTAKIKERDQAKKDFDRAKLQGKSASLLEQQRPNVFTMSVANIMPKDEVHILLHYTELLIPTESVYEFVYPTVVGPRYSNQLEATAPQNDRWVKSPYLKETETPPTQFTVDLRLSTGIPLQELESPSHGLTVSWKNESIADITLANPYDFGGDRDFILRYRLAGETIESGLLLYEGEKENFFLLLLQPPERVEPEEILPREYIFIIDVSGSMQGFPLDTAKVLIRKLINGLRATDRFNLLFFAGASELMAPRSLAATEENLTRALRMIDRQSGGGGTELGQALNRALLLPGNDGMARTLVVVTDGYIDAEKEAFSLISENLATANLFTFGIGSSVNRYLIEGLAKTGLGEPFVVTKASEAQEAAQRFCDYIRSPVLTKIRVRYEDLDAYDIEPSSQPDLFAHRPLTVMGKWRGEAKGAIEVSGDTSTGVYSQRFRFAQTQPQSSHSALKYLWARTRISRLSDFNPDGISDDTKAEVTRLGLSYGLLTPFTSFVAVLETRRNTEATAREVEQPLPLPLGVSDEAVGEFNSVPEPDLIVLLIATVAMLLLLSRRRVVC